MRRMLAYWLISRSIDGGRELPAWLRPWLIDEEAARFEASSRQLAATLRRDASAWQALSPVAVQSVTDRSRETWRRGRLTTLRRGVFAAAAVTLIAVGVAWSTRENAAPAPQQVATGGEANLAPTPMSPDDVALLMALMGESHTAWDEVVSVLASPTPRAIKQPRRQSLDAQVEAAVTFFAYRLPASTAKVAGLDRASAMIKSPSTLLRFWSNDRGA